VERVRGIFIGKFLYTTPGVRKKSCKDTKIRTTWHSTAKRLTGPWKGQIRQNILCGGEARWTDRKEGKSAINLDGGKAETHNFPCVKEKMRGIREDRCGGYNQIKLRRNKEKWGGGVKK